MCGIIAYKGKNGAADMIFQGLKDLEYRGYDSAGLAVAGNPSLKVDKGVGTIDEVLEKREEGTTGIGHTRWATHGEVNDSNAHPHTDCSGSIAVVHNGIVDNHTTLKKELEGHDFSSDTDTEVIPHLIEQELEKTGDARAACENVISKLEGSYAVAAMFDTGELIAFRKGSPLVLGISDDGYFAASDVTPFLKHTDQAVFLEDGDLVVIDDGHEVYSGGEQVERPVETVEWDAEQATKSGHDHFMQKEIHEQSTTVKRAVFQDRSDIEKAVEMMESADKIYTTGCGTAGIAASIGAKYMSDLYDIETELSHELEYRRDEITENDLVIAVSQSGETADLLSLLDGIDAPVLAIVNVVGSTLARQSEHTLYVNAGPEIGVASTKAFTAQAAVLKLLSYAARGKLEEGRESLLKTADRIDQVIEQNIETVEELAVRLSGESNVYFIGRSLGKELAEESALKLKELSYIHAEAFPGGEFKHGTLALVEDGTPVVAFMKNEGYDQIVSNATEAQSRGADVIAVGNENLEGFKYFIEIPLDDNQELLEIVPLQMLAYLTSIEKGNNPDRPRNLAKSVTVK